MTARCQTRADRRISERMRRALHDAMNAPLGRLPGERSHWRGLSGVYRRETVNLLLRRGLLELDTTHDPDGRTAIPTVAARSVS